MFFTIFFGYSDTAMGQSSICATPGINMATLHLIGGWVAKALFAGTSLSGQTVTNVLPSRIYLPVIVTT